MSYLHKSGRALQSTGPVVSRSGSGSSYEPPPPHACSVKTKNSAGMIRSIFIPRRIGASLARANPPEDEVS